MRIYKTRADFTKLDSSGNPGIFAGTVCTITDETANPMYVFQGGTWDSLVTATTDPVTGGISFPGIALSVSDGPGYFAPKLPKLRAKLAKIRAGLTSGTNGIDGQLKIAFVGDSKTMGAGAGTGGTTYTNAARPKSYPRKLVDQFVQLGLAARADTFIGDQGMYNCNGSLTGYPAYDPRVVFSGTTGIYPNGGYRSLGGIYLQLKAGTDSLTFTPENAWDTAVIFYENGAAGVANLTLGNAAAITGGTTVTTENTGSASFGSQTITIAKASTSLIFTRASGAPVIRGVWCYDSTIPSVNIFGLGNFGTQMTTEQPLWANAFAADAYDCVVFNLTTNDMNLLGSAGVAPYITSLAAAVGYAKAAGSDVVICTPSVTTIDEATVTAYCSAIKEFGIANGIPVIDLRSRMGSWTQCNALGMVHDSLHENAVGYQDIATAIGNELIRP